MLASDLEGLMALEAEKRGSKAKLILDFRTGRHWLLQTGRDETRRN